MDCNENVGPFESKFTFFVDISDDSRGEGASRNGHKNFAGGSSPDAVVNRAPRSDGGKQKHQIVFACQLLGWGDVTA